MFAVGAEPHAVGRHTRDAGGRLIPPGRRIEEPDHPVASGGSEVFSIRAERQAEHARDVANGSELLACVRVPDLDVAGSRILPVPVAGSNSLAVGAEGNPPADFPMASECQLLGVAESFEVFPLPVPQARLARVQSPVGLLHIRLEPVVMCQGDPVEIEGSTPSR